MVVKKSNAIAFLSLGLLWSGLIQAQVSFNVAGNTAVGGGGTATYSVGQVSYIKSVGGGGSMSEGVQQPYEISAVGIDESGLQAIMKVYPNPTTDEVTIETAGSPDERLSYVLADSQGRQLVFERITTQLLLISMKCLPPSTYFLNILSEENERTQIIKIVKK